MQRRESKETAHGQHTTKYQSNLVPWPIRVFYCVSAVVLLPPLS